MIFQKGGEERETGRGGERGRMALETKRKARWESLQEAAGLGDGGEGSRGAWIPVMKDAARN